MGPIRQSLSNKGTSGSARPRNLRIGIQGKTQNDQKEIGIAGFPCKIPIFVASFYLSYRPYGILTAAPGSPGVVLFLIVRVSCPYLGRQTGVMLLYIVVHIQFAIIPRFGL